MNTKVVQPSAKRKPPAAGKGRKPGSLNKTTRTAKEAIALAAEKLGGSERLVNWAKEDPLNERAFWSSIYPKLLPLQLTGSDGRTLAQELAGLNALRDTESSR